MEFILGARSVDALYGKIFIRPLVHQRRMNNASETQNARTSCRAFCGEPQV
jgi:hypothetical protein